MKRLLTLFVAAVVALAAYPAFASVNNSAHDFLGTTNGRCGTCHVPHAANAGTNSRLWRDVVPGAAIDGTWNNSTVGKLCGYCHRGGNGVTISNGTVSTSSKAYHANSPAYNATSHGRAIARLTGAPLNYSVALPGTKPYLNTGAGSQPEPGLMECSSCHNPHDEGVNGGETGIRPFLRPGATSATTVSGFCNDCHSDRYTTAIASTTNHPVLIAYNPGADNTRSFIQAVAAMNTPVGVKEWSLGGKFEGNLSAPEPLNSGALIGCQSCHAVHNPAAAANSDGSAMAGTPRQLLAVSYGNSAVCEGCHEARGNGGAIGASGGDHPYDQAIGTFPMLMDGPLWATTEKAGAPIAGGAICTSCHKAHILTGDGLSYIRRAGSATWCASCHTSIAPAAHHSNKTQLGAANSDTDCNECHSGTGAQAHNGFGYLFDAASGCLTCHGPDGEDPVVAFFAGGKIPASHLTAKQGGGATVSHFVGTFVNDPAKGINVKTGRWSLEANRNTASAYLKNADGSAMIADQSCYNNTGVASATLYIRCESCHSVLGNIGRNAGVISVSSGWMNNLLLQDYQDDTKGEAAARAVNSDFCIGCHNVGGNDAVRKLGNVDGVVGNSLHKDNAITPPGIHPMTGWSITRAQDAGRTPTTLITGAGSYADAGGRPVGPNWVGTNGVSYPGTDLMDCDSCHRPHLGNLNWTPSNPTVVRAPTTVPVILEDSSVSDYAALCQDCHAY